MIAIVYLLAACFALIVGAQILITLGIIYLFKINKNEIYKKD
jgi:hypothetical protein